MNTRAIKQWIARTLLFLPSESAGQMLRKYRKKLANINEHRGTDYGLFLMDWSKMLWDVNNMESDKPYFIEKIGDGTDATAICLYKRGSDQYVILNKCLYDTKKDADGYRKEYWGNKTDDSTIWITLTGAIDNIERYNQEQKKKGVEYPKDYDECCYVLDDDDKMSLEKMNELRKLVNARNAYWKLYGKENGLGGSWKPDWDDGCYVIFTNGDGLIKTDIQFGLNAILAFPTAELRDMFYERFESEIKFCKELL